MDCSACHGFDHMSANDVAKVKETAARIKKDAVRLRAEHKAMKH